MATKRSTFRASPELNNRNVAPRRAVRIIATLVALAACFLGALNSWREGHAQLLASYGAATHQLEAVDRAAQLSPTTPEVHYVRASLLFDAGELTEATKEYEQAVALRPHDYALWLELGRARDQANDTEGALTALRESVRLAPFYAQPHWQLGNALYRTGRLDEAFVELRSALISNPKLQPPVLELAWAAFRDDAQAVERVINPQSASMHLALARLFVKHGKMNDAVAQFRLAGSVPDEERRSLLKEMLAAKHFTEAYEVWSGSRPKKEGQAPSDIALVLNGGFEEPISLDDPGFGWQLPRALKAVQPSQDVAEPREGLQSLQLVWNGNAEMTLPTVSQLILVGPHIRYQLRFAARTQEIITAGRPQIIVTDANSNNELVLAEPVTLPQGTSVWKDYMIEFETGETTSAVSISVRRQSCDSYPCPIFGRIWLDDFSMRKV